MQKKSKHDLLYYKILANVSERRYVYSNEIRYWMDDELYSMAVIQQVLERLAQEGLILYVPDKGYIRSEKGTETITEIRKQLRKRNES